MDLCVSDTDATNTTHDACKDAQDSTYVDVEGGFRVVEEVHDAAHRLHGLVARHFRRAHVVRSRRRAVLYRHRSSACGPEKNDYQHYAPPTQDKTKKQEAAP